MENGQWWNYVAQLIEGDTYKEAATKAGFDKSAFTRWKQGARADPEFAVKLARAYGVDVLEALVAAGFITEEEAGRSSTGGQIERELRKNLTALESASADSARTASALAKTFASPGFAKMMESITAQNRQALKGVQPFIDQQQKMVELWHKTAQNTVGIAKSITENLEPLKDFQAVYEAMTEAELELVDAGKAPDLETMEDLERWRADREPVDDLAARRQRRARGGAGITPDVPADLYAADSTLDEDELRWEYGEDPIDE